MERTPGKDLITIDTVLDERSERAANLTDITLVLNRHANAGDAELSVAPVEPDSVVFIEGYSSIENIDPLFKRALEYLSVIRTTNGKDNPDYVATKQHILGLIAEMQTTPAAGYMDFSEFSLREIQLLLEKDCIVRYADYESNVLTDNNAQFAQDSITRDWSFVMRPVMPKANIAKTIRSLQKGVLNDRKKHLVREAFAYVNVMSFMHYLDATPNAHADIAHTSDGKVKTYLLYGSAHADSLNERFQTDLSPKRIIIGEASQHNNIDKTLDAAVQNLPRRVAMAAIKSLYFLDSTVQSHEETIYTNLAPINDDKEAALKFLIEQVQISQEVYIDSGRATDWYTNSLNALIEKPIDK